MNSVRDYAPILYGNTVQNWKDKQGLCFLSITDGNVLQNVSYL